MLMIAEQERSVNTLKMLCPFAKLDAVQSEYGLKAKGGFPCQLSQTLKRNSLAEGSAS